MTPKKGFTPTPKIHRPEPVGEWGSYIKRTDKNHGHKSIVWGFTLIELLVVISIIGILSSIVLASLNRARSRARDTQRITGIKQIQLALELYFDGAGNSNYPPEVSGATACSATAQYGLETLVTTNYMPILPRDPSSSNSTSGCYIYNAADSGTRTTYHLGASLENLDASPLTTDRDLASGTLGTGNDFSGLSTATVPNPCNVSIPVGVAQPNGTELCFDVTP